MGNRTRDEIVITKKVWPYQREGFKITLELEDEGTCWACEAVRQNATASTSIGDVYFICDGKEIREVEIILNMGKLWGVTCTSIQEEDIPPSNTSC